MLIESVLVDNCRSIMLTTCVECPRRGLKPSREHKGPVSNGRAFLIFGDEFRGHLISIENFYEDAAHCERSLHSGDIIPVTVATFPILIIHNRLAPSSDIRFRTY